VTGADVTGGGVSAGDGGVCQGHAWARQAASGGADDDGMTGVGGHGGAGAGGGGQPLWLMDLPKGRRQARVIVEQQPLKLCGRWQSSGPCCYAGDASSSVA